MRSIVHRIRTAPPLAQNVLLGLAVSTVVGLGAEGAARLVEDHAPGPPPATEFITRWAEGETEFYTIKSTATGWPPWEDYNSEGVRDREHAIAPPAGVRRVACLGDSVTLGTGLAAEDAWPQLLQDRLDALGAPVEVLNVALGGWATRQERVAYERIARKYAPDVVLLGVCLNDIPELHNNLARPPRALAALHLRSALVRLAVGARRREIARIEELFERPFAPGVRAAYARFFDEVDALQDAVRRDGAMLGLVVFPYRRQVRADAPDPVAQEQIAAHCRARGIPVVDLRPALLELGEDAFADDVHLTAEGTARVAETVAASGVVPFEAGAAATAHLGGPPGTGMDAAAWLAALQSPDASWRAAAARALGNSGASPVRAVTALTVRLHDADARVRAAAAWALGGYREEARPATPALLSALEDPDHDVRAGACWTLGRLGDGDAAVPRALLARLDDPDANVRRRAGDALVRVGARCEGCLDALVARLAASSPARATAAWALGGLGPAGAPAVPALTEALGDGEPAVRRRAAEALGRIGPAARQAVPALVALIDDPSVGWSAIDALGGIGPAAAGAAGRLTRALKDQSSSVRWRAAQALARLGPSARAAGPDLARAAGDDEPNVRVAAADALARIQADADVAAPALARALADPDPRVRRTAAKGLGRLAGQARGRALDLIAATRDSDPLVRAAAVRALHQIGPSADVRGVLGRLAAEDPDEGVRTAARRALRGPALVDR